MTATVQLAPTAFELESCFVGNAVSTTHLGRYAEEVAHLAGAKVNTIASSIFRRRGAIDARVTLDPKSHPVAWKRSSGACMVRIELQLLGWNASLSTCNIEVTLPTGAAWHTHSGLDGSIAFVAPPGNSALQFTIVGWVDVTGCSLSTLLYWDVAITQASGNVSTLSRLSITEVPVDAIDPVGDPTQPALDPASTISGNRIVDGDDSTPVGLARMAYLQDQTRKHFRQHFQLVGIEADPTLAPTGLWFVPDGSTNGPIDWARPDLSGVTHDPDWHFQLRNLYDGAQSVPFTFAVRYRGVDVDSNVQVLLEGVGGASNTWQTLVLPATVGVWAWASVTVYAPTDGTDSIVKVKLRSTNSSATDDLYFSAIALIELEA